MAGNAVTLTFAGDATKLQKAADQAATATQGVGDAAQRASADTTRAGQATEQYGDRMGRLGAAAAGMSAAVGDAGGSVSALAAIQNRSADRAQAQARALADVEQAGLDASQALGDLKQAQLDLNQAQIDAKQAGVDAKQAILDQKQAGIDAATAQKDYNEAVKEHGRNSLEARQASQDLAQAQLDLQQAGVDAQQAQADLAQYQEDGAQAGRDMAQASRDAKDAQLNLNDAQRAADPSALSRVGTEVELVSTAALGLVGTLNLLAMANNAVSLSAIKSAAATTASKIAVVAGAAATGIATAAQWAWNIAMTANPIGLIIVGIGALIAAVVLIATKTTWFQDLWNWTWSKIGEPVKAVWGWIKDNWPLLIGIITGPIGWITTLVVKNWDTIKGAAVAAWNGTVGAAKTAWSWLSGLPGRIKDTFASIGARISAPFRAGFNAISRAWNNTVGRLSWSIPGWVPGFGGRSISAPRLPTFHSGGTVPGRPGENVLAMLQAGERVSSPSASRHAESMILEIRSDGSRLGDALLELLRPAIQKRGGDVQLVLGKRT